MAIQALRPLDQEQAVQALRAHPVPDPTGQGTPESMAAAGQAFELDTGSGGGIFIIKKNGHQLWIEAAAGRAADDLTEVGLELIGEIARRSECTEIAFQTARPGLVLKTRYHGFEIAGWIMKKKV